jgi:Flp pilus assembly protein TadG
MSLQLLVILVPVIFGLMGFALDLGRLYLIRGELNQAANAMALAAASQLAGTSGAADTNVNNAAQQALNETNGNRYNFGSTPITTGTVSCFSTLADASANNQGATTGCASPPPVFVQASISAPAPLLFFGLLPGGESRTTTVASFAVAGMSAPLCTGCGIVPIAVQTQDASLSDTVDWGFVPNSLYTLYYSCTGTPPGALAGTAVPYVLLNRVDTALDESDQMFRQGAQGIQGSVSPNPNACLANVATPLACVNIGDIEQIPPSGLATPGACSTVSAPTDVTNMLCGLESRLDTAYAGNCQTGVTDFGTLSASYLADTDGAYYTDYSGYSGNGRRIITLAIVTATLPTDTSCSAGMTVLGFRQFLLEPPSDGTGTFNATDPNGRIPLLYLGSVAPISQGWFDSRYAPACTAAGTVLGPGKVVLHQ